MRLVGQENHDDRQPHDSDKNPKSQPDDADDQTRLGHPLVGGDAPIGVLHAQDAKDNAEDATNKWDAARYSEDGQDKRCNA